MNTIAYQPDLANYTALTAAIDGLLARRERVTVAIDGRCASGKSGLGALLAAHYGATLFHMDDFFLRPEQRTPARFAEAGGNVDYERFKAEVVDPLTAGERAFTYTPFSCKRWQLGEPVTVQPARLCVVEGVYSHHPYLGQYRDLSVFLTVPPALQLARIAGRNGEEMLPRFREEWIPMEERYFTRFSIREQADLCIDTAAF